MSRCFPFPPPGFVIIGNKARDEALIESIKLRKEKRKEKKRLRKQENRETVSTHKKRKHEELEGSSCVTEEHGHPLILQNPSCSSDSTQNCSNRRNQVSFSNDTGSLMSANRKDHRQKTLDSQYTNLIKNLYNMVLPRILDKDEEWLFGGKPSDKMLNVSNVDKKFAVSSGVNCSGSSVQYPCARYLQEAQIFALPYTVPYF